MNVEIISIVGIVFYLKQLISHVFFLRHEIYNREKIFYEHKYLYFFQPNKLSQPQLFLFSNTRRSQCFIVSLHSNKL